ncbi:LysM peptidoglycan-binding domain-containing protein [Paenibacillus sp. URB8-2]|uniref:LysM peptidoglycan-binding domain-containing protein n=1 Tax=Paenibacillus sp. URB8-2 TaxID=2741301 RepID=UPI0015B86A62|nr:LysM peptidoglycan-binding domain-containing protein [Paenibacillus sp. URB8-2]BCG60487.1 hypothetical protein PUR_39120 [Paenibacillus sp. URB8-2]
MKIHMVKQGDTLYELSKKYGVPLDKLIEANPQIANPEVLAIGDKVKIPSVPVPVPDGGELFHKHTVMQGDTLWKLSKAWGIQLKDIIQANPQLKNPDVLKIGDIVNIPKKGAAPLVHQPEHAVMGVSDKTVPGGKAYTGPIEKAKETAPIAPVPVEPAPAPVNPMPVIPAPVIPAPVAPVTEKIHTESQSLFVQISVPAQEAVSLPPMPEHPKEYCACEPVTPCDKSFGYPGIAENPYYYDCPPTYPLYEAVQPIPYAPSNVQPAAYMPEMQAPYCYPAPVYPVANIAAPCYPGVMPGYTAEMPAANVKPYPEHPAYTSPQYGIQPATLPWPSCGCDGLQPYPGGHEAPVYGAMPVYTSEAQSFPYGMGFPPPYSAPSYPPGAYGSPVTAGIPQMPEYPGKDDWDYLSRIPGETQADAAAGELSSQEGLNTVNGTAAVQNAAPVETKAASATSAAKVKTSSRSGKDVKPSGSAKQNSSKSRGTSKKRRNPWISD